MRNITRMHEPFTPDIIDKVWEKGRIVPGYDPEELRQDGCGAWIRKSLYGVQEAASMGWEIDHIKPTEKGGQDIVANLQPLQWENNKEKADAYPHWSCAITGRNEENGYV